MFTIERSFTRCHEIFILYFNDEEIYRSYCYEEVSEFLSKCRELAKAA